LDLSEISWLTWKLLLVYEQAIEDQERGLRMAAKDLIEVLAART